MSVTYYEPSPMPPSPEDIQSFGEKTAEVAPNTYITKVLYPSNLINDNSRYGNQFMALYINVDTKPGTKFSGSGKYTPIVKDKNGTPVETSKLPGHLGSVVNNFTQRGISSTLAAGGNIRGGDQGKQTLYAVYLPIPMNLATAFGVEYEEFSFGSEAAKLGMGVLKSGVDAATKSVSSVIGKGFGAAIKGLLNSDLAANAVSVKTGLTINPHKQLLFKGVGLRNFDFTYKLIARNSNEANVIDWIIRLLRFYMHPDLDGAFLYTYPSEFDMEFFVMENGNPIHNKYLPFFSTSVLKDLTVNYGGGKEFASHKDGSPVEYELTLKFQETQILNKTVINAFDTYVNNGGLQIQPPPGPIDEATAAGENAAENALTSFFGRP